MITKIMTNLQPALVPFLDGDIPLSRILVDSTFQVRAGGRLAEKGVAVATTMAAHAAAAAAIQPGWKLSKVSA
jgi:hypothetical protein